MPGGPAGPVVAEAAAATLHGTATQLTTEGPAAAEAGQLSWEGVAAWLQGAWREQRAALAALPATTAAAMCGTGAVAGFASGLLGIGRCSTPLLVCQCPADSSTLLCPTGCRARLF